MPGPKRGSASGHPISKTTENDVKPGDHPEFFRLAPPPGTSRESTIRLDREGRFWHDGALVENEALARALHSWIARHPDDGRYILTNGYDWTYFTVEDVPYFVMSVRVREDGIGLVLSDGSEEDLSVEGLGTGADGALYVRVKSGAFAGKFTRHAQVSLEPAMVELGEERIGLRVGDRTVEVRDVVGER